MEASFTMPDIEPEEQIKIIERAIDRWMDEKFAVFGKWTFYGLLAAALALLAKFLFLHGWDGPLK